MNSILLEHPTGRKWKNKDGSMMTSVYSLPKGEIDEGEDKADAAIREIKEETNLDLDKKRLKYLGKYEYLEYKDLEIFFYNLEEDKINLKDLKCDSFFEAPNGKMLPEVNGYVMANLESEFNLLFYSQQKVLRKVIADNADLFV
jgi:predicted NUDIX family NTP pyrophosphohydrolase